MHNNFLNKLCLFLIILGGLFLFVPNTVIAAGNPIQMEHKSNVPVDKVWKIKFNRAIKVDNLNKSVKVYNPVGISVVPKNISYDNNIITVEPPVLGYIPGQTYSLQVYETITDLDSISLKSAVTMNFTIAAPYKGQLKDAGNKKYVYQQYNNTLDEIVDMQSKVSPVNVAMNYPKLNASKIDVYEYMNPKNFENHDYGVYQFLKLNYIEGITSVELDAELKGVLVGQGELILKFCKLYDVNPAYIVAHAMLETGNGTSVLATGMIVSEVAGVPKESKITYNMFGIGARDANALKLGSEKAYTEGWFTPEAAIEGGIKFISNDYINKSTGKQNTVYKMRWNPDRPATHQYATDIVWAYKQSYDIKEILDKYTNAQLVFEIPLYK